MNGIQDEIELAHRALWCAVLQQAAADLHDHNEKVRREALWFFLHDFEMFPEICYLAGFDGEWFPKKFRNNRKCLLLTHMAPWVHVQVSTSVPRSTVIDELEVTP